MISVVHFLASTSTTPDRLALDTTLSSFDVGNFWLVINRTAIK
jgi:hypothetical protein